ncbi:hypothetical protein [Acetobacter conturbans]|uniref:Uncharacterized protein n=1 Tax=Acetobacter conturbans TaxID=1737472 RepID=A0ABX0K3N2_9PROT|nr:hypothetical protein [Acetobacter conturbans]NHN90323.1 hypothetical protein [Acetobacter conturbans]
MSGLGNVTPPRQAARTAAGRKKVAKGIKGIENTTASAGGEFCTMAAYDFG